MLIVAAATQQLTLRRAAKFGVEFKEPGKRPELRHVVRKEKALEQAAARAPAGGINTGFDLYSEVRSLQALPRPFGRSKHCPNPLVLRRWMLRRQGVQDVVSPASHQRLISIPAPLLLRMPVGTCISCGAESGTCSCSM